MTPPRLAVLMTCHDRRSLTLACLDRLVAQTGVPKPDVYLVDDGSHDGTGEAVAAALPHVMVLPGDGTLWWNGGMRRAWAAAASAGIDYDGFVWLNDDVELVPDALERLVAAAREGADAGGSAIVAGSTVDPATGAVNYGGSAASTPGRPLRLQLIEPGERARPVDTISGNVVLVSRAAHQRLGNIDPRYEHIYGDLDYGFRARVVGVPVILAPGVFGTCGGNPTAGTSSDRSLGVWRRLRLRRAEDRSRHARDWRRFARRWSGLGPLSIGYSVAPYLRILMDARR